MCSSTITKNSGWWLATWWINTAICKIVLAIYCTVCIIDGSWWTINWENDLLFYRQLDNHDLKIWWFNWNLISNICYAILLAICFKALSDRRWCVLEVVIINFSYDLIFEPIIMLHLVFLEIQVWLFETSECQKYVAA